MKPEKKAIEMTDDEKTIHTILENVHTIDLSDLKTKSNLSNKKWDKAIKGLTSKKLAKVYKEDDNLKVGRILQMSTKK